MQCDARWSGRRSVARAVGALVAAAAVLFAGAATAGAAVSGDGASTTTTTPPVTGTRAQQAKTLAEEVCETMVQDAVVSVAGAPLPAPQVGAWAGKQYTCTYALADGQFVIRVDTYKNHKKARHAYAKAIRKTKIEQDLLGIGQQAVLARDGHVIALKDLFVLSADPSGVPTKGDRANFALAAASAVLSCWVGTHA
jgi:hypothetical protein